MPMKEAAAVAAGAVNQTLSNDVKDQMNTNADASQCLQEELATGKNPAFSINGPKQNNPKSFEADDAAMAAGAMIWMGKVLGIGMSSISKTQGETSKQLFKTNLDLLFDPLTPNPIPNSLASRMGRMQSDFTTLFLNLNQTKSQGHKVSKANEVNLTAGRYLYNQAGVVSHTEAPVIFRSGRTLIDQGGLIFHEAEDIMSRSQTVLQSTNVYTLSCQRLVQLSGQDGQSILTQGDVKVLATKEVNIRTMTGKIVLFATVGSVEISALADKVSINGTKGVDVGSMANVNVKGGAGVSIESPMPVSLKGSMVFLGGSGTAPSPVQPSTDTVIPPATLLPIVPTTGDAIPEVLVEKQVGQNPTGVITPRATPGNELNVSSKGLLGGLLP